MAKRSWAKKGVKTGLSMGAEKPDGHSLPLLRGVLPIDTNRLASDVVAGVTLAALGIPEVMGYTKISGTPIVTGLYTLLLPVIAFALLESDFAHMNRVSMMGELAGLLSLEITQPIATARNNVVQLRIF